MISLGLPYIPTYEDCTLIVAMAIGLIALTAQVISIVWPRR